MPYDDRPVSEGGNRGIDELFSRKAPKGKFRVIGVDTFDGGDWKEGDFKSKKAAIERSQQKGCSMTKMYVYDDQGRCISNAGTF
jgi:hypothetical protein